LDGPEDAAQPLPSDALPVHVDGQRHVESEDGFGQLWRKRYRVRLAGANVTPVAVIQTWRARFGEFWPVGNRFYRPLTGLQPGEVALLDLAMPAGTRLSTGIVVVDVSDTAFTFATVPGHTFAGRITFSAHVDAGATVAQVEMLMRASDPLYELSLPLGGHRRDDRFWQTTLTNLAAQVGVSAEPETVKERVDRHRRWRNATNIVHNAFIRTTVSVITRPFRRLAGRLRSRSEAA
jgi:hypothetical protein